MNGIEDIESNTCIGGKKWTQTTYYAIELFKTKYIKQKDENT